MNDDTKRNASSAVVNLLTGVLVWAMWTPWGMADRLFWYLPDAWRDLSWWHPIGLFIVVRYLVNSPRWIQRE